MSWFVQVRRSIEATRKQIQAKWLSLDMDNWGQGFMNQYVLERPLVTKQYIRRLEAVADAARNEALLWNEELCSSKEADEREVAIEKLEQALKQLDEVRWACPPHEWDRDGERCKKFGGKDWM